MEWQTTQRESKIFPLLKKYALEESDNSLTSCHAAAVVHKGRVISMGVNHRKTHPLAARFSKNDRAIYLHAELDATVRAINLVGVEGLKRCSLYVLRVTRDGEVANSKPCRGCQKAIDFYGFKKVYWS